LKYHFINTNFTAGEITPRMMGRTDVARYNNGAKKLENVIPLIHGGVVRRPGLRYVATSKDSTKACRLLKFTYNTDQSYIIELGDLYARFYNDAGAQIESSPGVPYEVVTPYTEAQIWQVDYCQGADTMFLFHPSFAPYRLQRFADDNWRLMVAPIDPEPFDELGILASMICTLSSAAVGSRTFTAASAIFQPSDVGRTITSGAGIGTITGYTSSTVVTVNVTTAFASTLLAASDWTIESSPQTACTPSATGPVGSTITLTLAAGGWRSDDVGRFVNINAGLCKITQYTSATVVSAQVRIELSATVAAEANAWFLARSMWGGANGYPRTGSLYQQRMFVAGSIGFPQSVWFSELGNPYSFEIGAEADMGYEMRLVSDQANPVLNLASGRAVLALTSGTEFSLGGDGGVSPATITAINQSAFGSADITPCRMGNELLFVNRSGLKIRAMAADRFDSNQYAAPDITALAEHITESGIIEIDAQTDPENILWCVRGDGQMATCTLDRDNEVVAWARQITDGLFESVCVVPFGNSYSVWVVVQRVINGVNVRYIERFDWNVALDSALSSSSDGGSIIEDVPLDYQVGEISTSATFGAYSRTTDIFRDGAGGIGVYYDPAGTNGTAVSDTIKRDLINASLSVTGSTTITHQAGSPGDDRFWFRTGDKDGNIMGADDNFGYCEMSVDGVYKARLEQYAAEAANWWFSEFSYYGNGAGGLLWVEGGEIWHCRRFGGTGPQFAYWSSIPSSGLVAASTYKETTFSNRDTTYCHLAEDGTYYVYSDGDDKLYTWDVGTNILTEVLSIDLGGTFGMFAFAVHRGKLMVLQTGPSAGVWRMRVYNLADGAHINDVTGFTDPNSNCTKIIATDSMVYVKAGTKLYAVSASVIGEELVQWSGIDHLEGSEVQVIGDGILQTEKTVTAGVITIDSPAVYLDVGLPYTHKVVTLSPEIQGPSGSIQGKIQRAYEVALLLKDTIGATVNGNFMTFQTFGPTVLDTPIDPFTGWKNIPNFGYDTVNEITITGSDPLPFHLLAVVRRIDVGDWS
jgi:hypothetical protein